MPDLTALAKIVTGGLPGGALCGRAEIMELMSNATPRDGIAPAVSHKGTFNGAPIVAAAACAAMPLLATGDVQAHADRMAERMRMGMNAAMSGAGVTGLAYGDSSVFHLHFGRRRLDGMTPAEIRGPSECDGQSLSQRDARARGRSDGLYVGPYLCGPHAPT